MKKKMLSMLIAAVCLAEGTLTGAAAIPFRAGDANCDGKTDVSDAVLIARFAAEDVGAVITDLGRANADVTHDGNTDTKDIARILEYIARKISYEELAGETAPVTPVQPASPQPVSFQSIADAAEAFRFYDLSGYQETDRKVYEQMFGRFRLDGFFWQPVSSGAYALRADCVLYPYAAYEDIGIGYYAEFGGKTCHVVIYSADKELRSQTDGIADYLSQRMGRRTDKTVTVQGRAVSLTLADDGTVYAGAFLDDTHFYAVHGELSEAEMQDFLHALTFETRSIQSSSPAAGASAGKESPGSSARIALQCSAFCPAGEALTVDAAVGYAANISDSDQQHFEYGVCAWNPVLYKQYEDANLRINGEPDGFVKTYPSQESGAFAVDMYALDYETWHHETTVLDFSRYEAGSTGRIRFSFTLYHTENPEHPSSMGADRLLYYFVGETGTGLGGSAAEAEQNYRSASDAALLLHNPYTGKWNGKFVDRELFDALTQNTGEKITVSFDVNPDYEYVYNGRTLEAYSRDMSDVFNETLFKMEELLWSGDALKYGEVLYTTGTPDGQKWTQEWYEDRIAYFGAEMLSQYIADGEFRKAVLEADLAALKQQYQAAYSEAEAASYQAVAANIIETLAAQSIRCEKGSTANRLVMEVTADEFAALTLEHVTAFWLGSGSPAIE